MSKKFSKLFLTSLEQSVIAGLAKLPPGVTLPVGGKLVTSTDLQARLQAHVATMRSADDARAKLSQFAALDHAQRAEMAPVLTGIRNYVSGLYGEQSSEFAAFGFKPRKTPQQTAESKVEAAAKRLATRAARHTMGKRQRLAIHGVVPAKPATAPASLPVNAGASGPPTASAVNGVSH